MTTLVNLSAVQQHHCSISSKMRTINIGLLLLAAVTVTTALSLRRARDVAEAYNYLPPNEQFAIPATEPAPAIAPETTIAPVVTTEIGTDAAPTTLPPSTSSPASSVRGKNGYEYRAVRRLKYRYRTQRDVSHLYAEHDHHQQYLPPKHEYLPPQHKSGDDIDADTDAVAAPVGEYLPPASTEAAVTEAPETEPESAPEPELEPELESDQAPTEAPQDTAILAADGYHYKQPEVPFEIEPQPASGEYLPPLEPGVVEAEGPEGESAILADDGYHYRVIKRFRF